MLQRNILHSLQGANWQRGGGRGQRPKPIPLPVEKPVNDKPKVDGADVAARLRDLGLMPGS